MANLGNWIITDGVVGDRVEYAKEVLSADDGLVLGQLQEMAKDPRLVGIS